MDLLCVDHRVRRRPIRVIDIAANAGLVPVPRSMNPSLMLWALHVGSLIGLGEAIAETASASWAESVGDHWPGLVASSLVVFVLWSFSQSFTHPTLSLPIPL